MDRFCTNCGNRLGESEIFCTACGARSGAGMAPVAGAAGAERQMAGAKQTAETPGGTGVLNPRPHRPRRWVKLVVIAVIAVLFFGLIGAGVWKAGEMTGLWHNRAVDKAFNEWTKQKDLKQEEKAIFTILAAMQDELEAGDMQGAMEYVHPDCRTALMNKIMSHQDKISLLISMMDTYRLTYLSTDEGNYEAQRMALVQIGMPSQAAGTTVVGAGAETGTHTVILVRTEDGWVVEDIS